MHHGRLQAIGTLTELKATVSAERHARGRSGTTPVPTSTPTRALAHPGSPIQQEDRSLPLRLQLLIRSPCAPGRIQRHRAAGVLARGAAEAAPRLHWSCSRVQ